MKIPVSVVEDNEWYARLLKHTLELNEDFEVSVFHSAKEFLGSKKEFAIVTLDYRLPDLSGEEVLDKLMRDGSHAKTIVISEQNEIEVAVKLLQKGAFDYLVKGDHIRDDLLLSIQKARKEMALEERIQVLESRIDRQDSIRSSILGEDEQLLKQIELIEKAAKSDINVVVTGETGTGKEVAAKAIHNASDRKDQAFVAVNISAIPSELIESELFGHVKGSFTGAVVNRTGLFEEAGKGTLFLDEIGEMDIKLQAKLLRVLQEHEFTRVGESKPRKVQCRIISATNRSLEEMVRSGSFREDLYYRLYGINIHLPPLRERGNDKIQLAEFFMSEFCKRKKIAPLKLSPSAKKKLLSYSFPGNIRELKSIVELAITLSDADVIEADTIRFPELSLDKKLLSSERSMREYQHMILEHYLKKYDDITKVSSVLDISRSKIYRMIKEGDVSN